MRNRLYDNCKFKPHLLGVGVDAFVTQSSLFWRRVTNPCSAFDMTPQPNMCKGCKPMISVEYSKTLICIYSDNDCRNTFCPINKFHKRKESFFRVADVFPDGCLYIMDMIHDEQLDSSVRCWIKTVFVERKSQSIPQKIRDFMEREKPKIFTPLVRRVMRFDIDVGPNVVIPDDRKKP